MTWDRDAAVAMYAGGKGKTYVEIAEALDVNESSVRRWFNRHVHRRPSPDAAPAAEAKFAPKALPFKPVVPATRMSDTLKVLLYGDTHVVGDKPLSPTIDIVKAIAQDFKPDIIVHMGDLVDCYAISAYDKDPKRLKTLQAEIDQARAHLLDFRSLAPQFVLLEGNHEDRLRRLLWRLPAEAQALANLTAFQQGMTWPSLLGLEELNIFWVPTHQQPYTGLPNFLLRHGEFVRSQAAFSARAEHERFGKSGASGHSHRQGLYSASDWNGSHLWIECGHTGPSDPEYTRAPNWQPGFVTLEFDRLTGAVAPTLVNCQNGRAVWQGRVYDAA